jgi:hypothetical protein
MDSRSPNSANPSVEFYSHPEQFITEHCIQKFGDLETNVLEFLRKLNGFYKVQVPVLDINKFPAKLHTPKMMKAIEYFEKKRAA